MRIIQEPKIVALLNKGIFKRKNGECAAFLKNSVGMFVEKIYKMGCLEVSGVSVLYIERMVPKG
jgi:hypothetical protein